MDYCENIAAGDVTFEENIVLADAISMLSEKQEKIIIYKYCFQYNDVEIAEILHIRRETVNRNKQRALSFIKTYFTGSS